MTDTLQTDSCTVCLLSTVYYLGRFIQLVCPVSMRLLKRERGSTRPVIVHWNVFCISEQSTVTHQLVQSHVSSQSPSSLKHSFFLLMWRGRSVSSISCSCSVCLCPPALRLWRFKCKNPRFDMLCFTPCPG